MSTNCLKKLLKSFLLSKFVVVSLLGWLWLSIPGVALYIATTIRLFLHQYYLFAIVMSFASVSAILWTIKVSLALPKTVKDYYRTKKIFQVRGVRPAIIKEYQQCNDALCTYVSLWLLSIEFGKLD